MGELISASAFVLLHIVHPIIVFGEMVRWIRGWKIFFRPEERLVPAIRRGEANEPIPDEESEVVDEHVPVPNAVLPPSVVQSGVQPKKVTVYVYEF